MISNVVLSRGVALNVEEENGGRLNHFILTFFYISKPFVEQTEMKYVTRRIPLSLSLSLSLSLTHTHSLILARCLPVFLTNFLSQADSHSLSSFKM